MRARNRTVGEHGALLQQDSDYRFAAEKALEKFKTIKVWSHSTSNQARSDWLDRSVRSRLTATLTCPPPEPLPEDEDADETGRDEDNNGGMVDDERKKQKLLQSLLRFDDIERGWDSQESSLRSCGFLVIELASLPYVVSETYFLIVGSGSVAVCFIILFLSFSRRCCTRRSSTRLWVRTCLLWVR